MELLVIFNILMFKFNYPLIADKMSGCCNKTGRSGFYDLESFTGLINCKYKIINIVRFSHLFKEQRKKNNRNSFT
ncbi:hypothetical protein GCM10027284_30600 [Cyclobacterium sediminis]